MKDKNARHLFVLKWEFIQLLFFLFFLVLFYLMEMAAAGYLKQNNSQVVAIHSFLNSFQFPLLPDYFFYLFFPLMLVSVSLIIFKRWRWFFLSFCGVFISVLFAADRIYFSFFSSFVTVQSFSAAGQVWDVKSSIIEAVNLMDMLFIFAFCVFIFFGIILNKKIKLGLPEGKIAFLCDKVLGVLICLLAIYTYNIAFFIPKRYVVIGTDHVIQVSEKKIDYDGAIAYAPNYEASNRFYADAFGLMNFHVKNFTDTFKDKFLRKPSTDLPVPKGIYDFFEGKKSINEITSPFYGIAQGRNVFLIHFESLSPILTNLLIDGMAVTPTLNKLEKNCLYWEYILNQVTIGGSSDAEFSSLTGMLPGTNEMSAFNTSCMPLIPALPRQLRSMGYETLSFHGFEISFWNRNISQPLLGFENMYFKKAFHYDKRVGFGVSDKDFFSQSIDLLEKHTSPFFAFLITLSSHHPYRNLPKEYENLFTNTVKSESLLSRYLQAIRFSDDALGEFFEKIKKLGYWENSIFIIYGDHRPGSDDEMNETLIEIAGKSLDSPRYTCVPIFIAIPGHEDLIVENKDKYEDIIGGLYDIFPTIMHLIGGDIPFGVFGSHLFVRNSERDPAPFFRFKDSFVFNGIQYLNQGREVFRDNVGLVFTDDSTAIISSHVERLNLYRKALLAIDYCNYIYAYHLDLSSYNAGELKKERSQTKTSFIE